MNTNSNIFLEILVFVKTQFRVNILFYSENLYIYNLPNKNKIKIITLKLGFHRIH